MTSGPVILKVFLYPYERNKCVYLEVWLRTSFIKVCISVC